MAVCRERQEGRMTSNIEDSTRSGSCLGKLTMLPFLIIRAVLRWRP